MSLSTLMPSFSPGDVYHSYLVEFTTNVTNQNNYEDALNLIQAQLTKPLVNQLIANVPEPDIQLKRKRSLRRRLIRSKDGSDGAPMIIVPETTDRECIKTNSLSSIGFLAFVTSVVNAVIQASNNINNNNNNRNNNNNDNNQNNDNVNVANLASQQMNMNMVMVGRRIRNQGNDVTKWADEKNENLIDENSKIENVFAKLFSLRENIFNNDRGNPAQVGSTTGLDVQSTAKGYANTTFPNVQESNVSDEKIANYVLEALKKIPSNEASKTGTTIKLDASSFWSTVSEAVSLPKKLLGLRRKRSDASNNCQQTASGDLPYDVSLLGLSYVDLWLKFTNEEEPECLARAMCNHAFQWNRINTRSRSKTILENIDLVLAQGMATYLMSSKGISARYFAATGRLCLWKHREGSDRRLDDSFQTFERFRNSLMLTCDEGDAGILEVTPNITWPDVVYYQSYSQPYMGWKINIVDDFNKRYLITAANGGMGFEPTTLLIFIAALVTSVAARF